MGFFYKSIEKAGPGIKKDAPKKKAFFLFWDIFFRKFWKIFQVNCIYVLFCLPIVTFGPATAAYTYVLRNFAREEHAFVWMDFFDSFKKYWKKGLLASLFDLLFAYAIFIYYYFYAGAFVYINKGAKAILAGHEIHPIYFYVLSGITLGVAIIYLFMRPYLYTMIVTFNLKFREMLKNAFIFSIVGLVRNIISTACGIVLIWGALCLVQVTAKTAAPLELIIPLFAIIVLMIMNFLSIFATYPVIKKYMIDPVKEPQEEVEEAIFND